MQCIEKRHVKGNEYVQVLFFLLFVDTCIVKRERAEVPLTDLTQPCLCLFRARTWISNVINRGLIL
jgi:hypothetical protein